MGIKKAIDLDNGVPIIRDWVNEKVKNTKTELIGKDTDTSSDLTIKGVSKKIAEKDAVSKLLTARKIALSGAATGTPTAFDGTQDITIPVTEVDATKLTGVIPEANLPSYVDDVIEGYLYSDKFYKESAHTTEIKGEAGKIYTDLTTDKVYRWSGSKFTVISDTLSLGETASTAYRGDRGKIAYDHTSKTDNPHKVTKAQVGLSNVANYDQSKAISSVVREGTEFKTTALDGSTSKFSYPNATTDLAGLMSSSDKAKLNGIVEGATKVTIDKALSSSSENPVQNKVITSEFSKYLPLSGGTMTGQLKTSFKNSVAVGSYEALKGTLDQTIEELRYSSGAMGSFQNLSDYTYNNITIPVAWYNYVWIPHRSGGNNGKADGDNCNYGTLLLYRFGNTENNYVLKYANGAVNYLRNINDVDHAANADLALSLIKCTVKSGNTENYPFHRFAHIETSTNMYLDVDDIFLIRGAFNRGYWGIVKIGFRENASLSNLAASAIWLYRYGLNTDDIRIAYYSSATTAYADVFFRASTGGTWLRGEIIRLTSQEAAFSLNNSEEVSGTTASDRKTSTYSYSSIEDAAATLHGGTAYTEIVSGEDGGTVASATMFGGRSDDLSTENTIDTWVPVIKDNKIQHRVIPADLSTIAPQHLLNSRNFITDLGSTSSASFNGSADATLGVKGTLPIGNGGTGAATAEKARENLGLRIFDQTKAAASGSGIANIRSDGVMEVGKFIDFHKSFSSTTDYDLRLEVTDSGLNFNGGTYLGTWQGYSLDVATENTTGTWVLVNSNKNIEHRVIPADLTTIVPKKALALNTARKLTIGNSGKNFDGSGDVSWSLSDIGAVAKSGDTMTGQLKTSFKNSVAVGSYEASSHTVPDLCNELRYSSGAMGSVSITTAYTLGDVTVTGGWYTFIWVPHRSGGVNGAASGDNCSHGTLFLTGMTIKDAAYVIQYSNNAIMSLFSIRDTDTATTYVTTGSDQTIGEWTDGSEIKRRVVKLSRVYYTSGTGTANIDSDDAFSTDDYNKIKFLKSCSFIHSSSATDTSENKLGPVSYTLGAACLSDRRTIDFTFVGTDAASYGSNEIINCNYAILEYV